MSYCVNCGVELDASSRVCPLCNTPVWNPNEIPKRSSVPPFPTQKAQVEEIKRADFGWLVSVVALATAVTCGILNWLVFNESLWSLAVIGACVLLWVCLFPLVIYQKWSPHLYLLFDGATMVLYLYFIARMIGKYEWFKGIGVPIVAYSTVVLEILAFAQRKLPKGILTGGLYFFTAVGALCVGIEIIIDNYLDGPVKLGWSAVVFTVCFIIDSAIITTLSRRRLREAVRRRLHF